MQYSIGEGGAAQPADAPPDARIEQIRVLCVMLSREVVVAKTQRRALSQALEAATAGLVEEAERLVTLLERVRDDLAEVKRLCQRLTGTHERIDELVACLVAVSNASNETEPQPAETACSQTWARAQPV